MHKIAYACQFPCGQVPGELGMVFLVPMDSVGWAPHPREPTALWEAKETLHIKSKKTQSAYIYTVGA